MPSQHAMRGPPRTDEKAPADFDPRRGKQTPYPVNRQHPRQRSAKELRREKCTTRTLN